MSNQGVPGVPPDKGQPFACNQPDNQWGQERRDKAAQMSARCQQYL
jgi:hypothetical protein